MRLTALAMVFLVAWSVFAAVQPAAAQDPVYAVDISHWTGEITDEDVACWWDNGVRHVITGTIYPGVTTNQLETSVNGDMTVDAYVYLYWDYNITAQVKDALALIAPYPVQRLWIDAEQARGSFTQAQIVQKIQEAFSACGTMPCGIYTRKAWWRDNTGDSKAFSQHPIWYALYDNAANFDDWYDPAYWYEGPFGGWTQPTGKQYNDRPYLCDRVVDHNIMYTLAEVPPPAPTALSPDGASFSNGTSVTLRCDAITGVTTYEFEIWYQSDGTWNFYQTYSPNTNSKTFWPYYGNASYQWKVRAKDSSGWGAWSAWATFRMAVPAPTAPIGLAASAISASRIDLSWTDTSTNETGFKIERKTGAGGSYSTIATVGANVTTYSNTGLSAGTAYYYRVYATNAGGNSAASKDASATTCPPAPTGLTATAVSSGQVNLTWKDTSTAESGFQVYRKTGAGGAYGMIASLGANVTTYSNTGLSAGTAYYYKVYATNAGGNSVASNEAFATTTIGLPAPNGISPDSGKVISTSSVTLSCTAVSSATQYEFYIEYQKGGVWVYYYTYASTTPSKRFYPSFHGTNYRWKVRAKNASSTGPWSAWATFNFK